MTQINTIIFDIGGVLALGRESRIPKKGHVNVGLHEDISKKLNISLDQWFDAIDSTYADSIKGTISETKTLSTISKNTNVSKRKLEKILFKAYKTHFIQNEELYKLAFKLKLKGYKIAILSDQWLPSKKALLLKKYIKKFDAVLVSCDIGMRKPNLKIYKLTLKKLRARASEAVFIDNQNWNLIPAKKIGMKTILFKNNKQTLHDLRKLGLIYDK